MQLPVAKYLRSRLICQLDSIATLIQCGVVRLVMLPDLQYAVIIFRSRLTIWMLQQLTGCCFTNLILLLQLKAVTSSNKLDAVPG